MKNYNSKFKNLEIVKRFIFNDKKTSQKSKKIYSSGKGEDSPGSFGFERTRKTNTGIVSKIACEKRSLG